MIEKNIFHFRLSHEAYNYSISLLSAGMVELDFKGMTITEVGEEMFNSLNPLKPVKSVLKQVNGWAEQMAQLDDQSLKDKTTEFRERLDKGESLDDLLPEAYAVVREAAKRVLGMFPYDVQVMGAIVMHQGNIAEMSTGEGKTLTATMPVYLNALTGQGAILVTTNEYLAKRDAEEMGQVYEFLGLTIGVPFAEDGEELDTFEKKGDLRF